MENNVQPVSVQKRNRSRIALVGLFILFLVPVVAAIILHSIDDGIGTNITTNKGELVRPVQPLQEFSFGTLEGNNISLETLKGSWSLVYIDSATCNEQCENNLYKVRQSRLAMGGEKERVQRLMVLTDGKPSESLKTLLKEHPGMHVVSIDGKALDDFLKPFNHDENAAGSQRIYIIDPFGNLMMQYAAEAEPKHVVKDLERLLKYSRTG